MNFPRPFAAASRVRWSRLSVVTAFLLAPVGGLFGAEPPGRIPNWPTQWHLPPDVPRKSIKAELLQPQGTKRFVSSQFSSHPELLGGLARDFMRQGWSTKQLVRQLVLSESFKQSGVVSEAAKQKDPANRQLHHYPTRRLEAEAIRDAMLAVSGRLDDQLYGRSINPLRTTEDAAKRLFSGPLDGDGRRSLYLTMSIMAPPKFLMSFDLPDLRLPSGRRNVTNVPTQAHLLLNDPLVDSLARHWASGLIKTPHASPEERLESMFITAFGRTPTESEKVAWTALLQSVGALPDVMADEAAWTQLAHTIFNSQEFIYYR